MEIVQVMKSLWLVVTIVVVVFCGLKTLIRLKRNELMAPSFKQLLRYLLTSDLLSDTMCLLNLLLSMASGIIVLYFTDILLL